MWRWWELEHCGQVPSIPKAKAIQPVNRIQKASQSAPLKCNKVWAIGNQWHCFFWSWISLGALPETSRSFYRMELSLEERCLFSRPVLSITTYTRKTFPLLRRQTFNESWWDWERPVPVSARSVGDSVSLRDIRHVALQVCTCFLVLDSFSYLLGVENGLEVWHVFFGNHFEI